MSEWQEISLQEIAIVNPTETLKKDTLAKKIPMEFLPVFTRKVIGFQWEKYNGGVKFRNGDTLVARITPSLENGKTSYVDVLDDDEVGFGSTEFIVLREVEGLSDKEFLYYFARSPDFRDIAIASMTGSSGRQRVQTDVVKQIEFLIPTLSEQKAIASVLSSLDDKIDLLHRQNKTLEAMAETLFRQWFVDNESGDAELVELGSVVETTSGGTPSRKIMEYYSQGSYFWVKSKELTGSYLIDTEEKITEDAVKNSSAKLLPKNSILIAMYGATVGEYAIISEEMTCNQAICALKANKKYPASFLFFFVKNNKDNLINMAVGSAQQNISQQLIKKLLLPISDRQIIEFDELTAPVMAKIEFNIKSIRTLEKLRDTLLPKLMSGEVRVKYEEAA